MSEKYVRPSVEEIEAEAARRGILELIETDSEAATINLHRRIMELENKAKIKSPESPLIAKHTEAITDRADKNEKEQADRDAQEAARNAQAEKKAKAKF